ncbi:MAG: hypothetical protein MJ157_04695, partial [Clostridia bacterium]|nr:hypothetical protein [Clostridia bacterium]
RTKFDCVNNMSLVRTFRASRGSRQIRSRKQRETRLTSGLFLLKEHKIFTKAITPYFYYLWIVIVCLSNFVKSLFFISICKRKKLSAGIKFILLGIIAKKCEVNLLWSLFGV